MQSNPLHCVVVTPEKALLDEVCDFVAVPMHDGELGVLPGRLPLIGRLGFGELRTKTGDKISRYFVDGGFVQIKENVVTVLTSRAIRGEEIRPEAAEAVLKGEAKPGTHAATPDSRLIDQARARAQIRVARNATRVNQLTLENA